MSSGAITGAVIGAVAVSALVVAIVVLGVVGVSRSAQAGTQTQVCGTPVGVNVSGETVQLLGVSGDPLTPGDRVRVSPVCVIEVLSIDTSRVMPGYDGGGATVKLKWRLW